MEIKQLVTVYFSPTGSTKGIVDAISRRMDIKECAIDVTVTANPLKKIDLGEEDLLLVGIPVYAGRVPKTAMERFRYLRGNDTPAVVIAVYGNREYDDALIEMKLFLEERGFKVVGAAAFVAEHSIVRSIAAGRPDGKDKLLIREFAERLKEQVLGIRCLADEPDLKVKGNPDLCAYHDVPFKPHSTKECVSCGSCAVECPTGAIPEDTPTKTKKDLCISCMRCIGICPRGARKLYAAEELLAKTAIEGKCKGRKEPEFFFTDKSE